MISLIFTVTTQVYENDRGFLKLRSLFLQDMGALSLFTLLVESTVHNLRTFELGGPSFISLAWQKN